MGRTETEGVTSHGTNDPYSWMNIVDKSRVVQQKISVGLTRSRPWNPMDLRSWTSKGSSFTNHP